MTYDEAIKHCIFRFVSGSQAYGTSTPESDEDFRGVFIAPLSKAFELFQTSFVGQGNLGENLRGALHALEDGDYNSAQERIRQALATDQGDLNLSVATVQRPKPAEDEELQELRKFLKLAADNNPNIIEFLYVDRLIHTETEAWKKIKAARHLFLSRKAKHTFSGYAIAQLKRIETHRGYLLNPPSHKPTRAEFGLPEQTTIPTESRNAILTIPDEWVQSVAKETVLKEKAFQAANHHWNSYKSWERTRNEKRKIIEAKHGYDTKHAMHLVRLINMAKEILKDGTLTVYRPEREELKSIRNGGWSFERLQAFSKESDVELNELAAKSPLRDSPDHKGIAKLYVEVCEAHYGKSLS